MSDIVSPLNPGVPFPLIGGSSAVYSVFTAQGQPGGLPVPDASYVGMYARVNDLFGASVVDLMLCQSYMIGGTTIYRWRPVRDSWPNVGSVPVGTALTLTPLQTPTIIRLSGTMTGAMTITPSTANAYPGLTYDIRYDGLLSLFGINLAGVLGSNVFLTGQNKVIYFDGTQFIQRSA